MWGCFDNCVCFGNMCSCIYRLLYYLYCDFVLFRLCIFILVCLSVLVKEVLPPSDSSIAVSNNNNNNNNNIIIYLADCTTFLHLPAPI